MYMYMHVQVSATYLDGYRAISVSPVIGPRVVEKSQKVADAILSRLEADSLSSDMLHMHFFRCYVGPGQSSGRLVYRITTTPMSMYAYIIYSEHV